MTAEPHKYYYRQINTDLLNFIPRDARTILEVGCGEGKLGEAYKRQNPMCDYRGIELHAESAKRAEAHLDKVLCANVETADGKEIGFADGKLDCLIYGDVLEHLQDPWATLKNQAHWLKEDGIVVACIPNIGFWSTIGYLIRGQFPYKQEGGLFDQSHLRFFTAQSIEQMFRDAGLTIYNIAGRPRDLPHYQEFLKHVKPLCDFLSVDFEQYKRMANQYQFLVQAGKRPAPRQMLLQSAMLRPIAACNDVRVIEPSQCMQAIPGVVVSNHVRDLPVAKKPNQGRKVLIWQRPLLHRPDDYAKIKLLVECGYLLILEFDDDPDYFKAIKEHGNLTLKGTHAIQTTNEELAEIFRQYNPNVAVFPNQIYELPPYREVNPEAPVRLFFGALNREKEAAMIAPVINRLLAEYPQLEVNIVYDKTFYDALETDRKRFMPLCDYATYRTVLYQSDILLMPLVDNRFSRLKSDLKYIEAAAHSVVAVASPTVYGKVIKQGETGFIFNSPEEMEAHLRELLSQPQLRSSVTKAAYEYVKRERMLSQHFRKRYEWYCELYDQLPELNRQLREREPEVFTAKGESQAA